MSREKGVAIDTSHHHHTIFYWQEFMVDNHYDFINVHHHKSHVALEKILKDYGRDDSFFTELYGEKIWLPSPNQHALSLMKHLMLHFSTGEITLRQLFDWGFFVRAHGKDVDWGRIERGFDQFKMKELYGIFNAICVEYLGFDAEDYNYVLLDSPLKQCVFNDIMCPEFTGDTPHSIIPRLAFKYRRWRANEWKHRLCYSDSMWSAFWSGVWGHILRPASI